MNIFLTALLVACLTLIQCLIGGTRLVWSFPAYALVASAAVLSLVWIRRPLIKPARLCLLSTLLLAGYVFWRAWVSPVPYLARTDAFMIAGALLVYLLTALYVTDSRPRFWIVASLLAVAVLHVYVGLHQFRGHNGFMLFGFLREDVSWRASGLLICGNHLAGYLESLALLALSVTFWSRMRLGFKMLSGYIAGVCYLGVILSGSRGGYLSSIVSLAGFGLLCIWVIGIYRRRNLSTFFLGIFAAGFLVLCGTGYVMTHNTFIQERLKRLAESSQDVRVYNWLASLDQYRLSPVVGTGAGTHLYYGRLFRRPQIQVDPVHSHGDYLELLAEYGIIGELLALFFLGTHLFNGLRSIHEITLRRLCNALTTARSDSLALALGATAAVIALMAHSIVDFNMHIPGNALLFAFIFGMLGNPGTDRPERVRSWVSGPVLLRGGLAILGIATLLGISSKYMGEVWAEQARVSLSKNDYQACIRQASEAIQADPSNFYPYFYQGEANRIIGFRMQIPGLRTVFFDRAVTAFQKSLELFPQDESLLVRLGQALDGAHRFEEAGEAYCEAIRWDPNLGLLYAYYAAHLELIGQPEAAKKCREAAARLGTENVETIGKLEARSILASDPALLPQK